MNFLRRTLIGIGQIFLQNNILSGLLIAVGMLFSHWALGVSCLLGSAVGTLTAQVLRFPDNETAQGLYGFNASLAMMCVLFTFGLHDTANPIVWLVAAFAAVVSTLVMRLYLKYRKTALTFPFVLTCWVVIGLISHYGLFGLAPHIDSLPNYTNATDAVAMPFYSWAEVNFGASPITGVLLFAAIAVNNPNAAMWATAAAVLAAAPAHFFFHITPNQLANGLYGYSAILAACVFCGPRFADFCYTVGAVFLSVPIQYFTGATGLPAYTFGFIAAVWIMLHIKKRVEPYLALRTKAA